MGGEEVPGDLPSAKCISAPEIPLKKQMGRHLTVLIHILTSDSVKVLGNLM